MSTLADYYTPEPSGSQAYGAARPGRVHTGDDFSHSTRPGTIPVPILRAGRVYSIQRNRAGLPNGYGNQVQVRHDDGSRFSYSHLDSISVVIGLDVQPGQTTGYEGNTGWTSGPCVHVEYWTPGGVRVDPYPAIRGALAAVAGHPLPLPIPDPILTLEDDMATLITGGGQSLVVGPHLIGFGSPDDVRAVAGAQVLTVSPVTHANIIQAFQRAQSATLPVIVYSDGGNGTVYMLNGGDLTALADPATLQKLIADGASSITLSEVEVQNLLKQS